MTVSATGTVVLTGPTRGLGRETTLALAGAAAPADLVLLGRPSRAMDDVVREARGRGARAHAVACDLASLGSVTRAAGEVRDLVDQGDVAPLQALVGNAAVQTTDATRATEDGFDLTFGVNHLSHFLLVRELWPLLGPQTRVVLVGSGVHRGGPFQRTLQVPDPSWRDPEELAKPAPTREVNPRQAYADSKLATLYFAHELQRRLGDDRSVTVFDPGLMPGTGLVRDADPFTRAAWSTLMKGMRLLPNTASPRTSGRMLARLAADPDFADLRDGAYVEMNRVTRAAPHAYDRAREERLWEVSERLTAASRSAHQPPGHQPPGP